MSSAFLWGKVPCDELTHCWGRVENDTPAFSYPLWGELGGYILYFIILGGWRGQDLWGWAFLVKWKRSLRRSDLF